MAFKVVLEVLLDVPEVVLVVLVVALMSRCPFQRLQSAGQQRISKRCKVFKSALQRSCSCQFLQKAFERFKKGILGKNTPPRRFLTP